jgi:hypothetical protein
VQAYPGLAGHKSLCVHSVRNFSLKVNAFESRKEPEIRGFSIKMLWNKLYLIGMNEIKYTDSI